MGYRLGVDLGTTYTAAAVARGGTVEAMFLGDGYAAPIPSVAFLSDDGSLVFGDVAVRRGAEHPERMKLEFKRRIGDNTNLYIGGTPVSAHVLTGELLGAVIKQVARLQGGEADEVVVTCPANWGPYRRELLDQAISISGVTVARVCTEPEAAALHFASTGRVRDGDAIAVYDLGGGTFDAAVLRQVGGGFTFLGKPEGIEQLGGLDFDDAIFTHILPSLGLPADDDDPHLTSALVELRRECAAAKEKLSFDVAATIPIRVAGAPSSVRVTRSELEELIGPLIGRTVDCLERVILHAGLSPAELAAVVMVGGSASIPIVSEQLAARLGRPVALSSQPKLCVAMGAALLPGPAVTTAVTPKTEIPAPQARPAQPNPPRRAARTWTPRSSRSSGYALAAGLLFLIGLVFAVLGPTTAVRSQLTWDVAKGRTTAPPANTPAGAQLTPTILGIELPGDPIKLAPADRTFPINDGYKLFLAGPVVAVVEPSGSKMLLDRSGGAWWSPFATIPGGALILGLLFALAYAESLLRELRKHRGRVHAGDLIGMAGVGLVLGFVLTLATWIGGRLLTPISVVLIVVSFSAAAGLLGFAVSARRTPH